jgi:monoamine oxidase
MGRDRQLGRRSARTPPATSARRSFALHANSERTGEPVGELRERLAAERTVQRGDGPTRRELLAGAGALAAGAALAHGPALSLANRFARPGTPRVAIVGAGLAGLRCAHRLWTESPGSPIASTIYEANPERAGGRCWTLRDFFADGLETEHGGSFLNSDQMAVRQLAARLGIAEEIVDGGDLPTGEEIYLISGRSYTYAEANADWAAVGYAAFKAAGRELHSEAGEARLDAMSVPEWLESTPIGTSSRFGKLMLSNVVTENGGDPGDMSALDLIELLSANPRSSLSPLPRG